MYLGKKIIGNFKGATKKKKNECSEDTLWKWFSQFIRLRDSDHFGMCKCATCNTVHYWKEMDAGHFISRRHKSTKYHEKNVLAQCPKCNRFHSGEQFRMAQTIDKRFGKGTSEYLSSLSRVSAKFDGMWFKAQSDKYREKVKEMKHQKRLRE